MIKEVKIGALEFSPDVITIFGFELKLNFMDLEYYRKDDCSYLP